MVNEVVPCWYGEAEPDGSWAGLVPDQHVLTNTEVIPLCPGGNTLYLRKRGSLLTCQGHGDGRNYLWNGKGWVDLGPSYGVSPVAFDLSNNVVQNRVEFGSQGIRWIDEAGIHTGDQTYGSLSLAMYQYTTLGGISIGQSPKGGVVAVTPKGRFQVTPPPTNSQFIRFNRDGDKLAVAIWEITQLRLMWFTVAELEAMPVDVIAPPASKQPPEQKPEPKPEPTPVSSQAPNQFAVVQRVFAAHPEIDRLNDDTRGRLIDYVIAELGGKPWGRKARNKDGSNLNTDGLTYLRTDGLYEIYDIIDGTSGKPTWDGGEPVVQGTNGWWAPGLPVGGGEVVTVPTTNTFANAAAALEARIAGIATAVDALKRVVEELKNRPVVKPEAVNLDGLKIALRTDNGHFLSAQDGGGGVVHTQRPEPGQPTEGYNPGAWETFQIVSR
jgi:hypothetical protein